MKLSAIWSDFIGGVIHVENDNSDKLIYALGV